MKHRVITGFLAAAAITAIIVYFRPADVKDVSPEFVLSYADNQTEDYPTTLGAEKFAELVEERTEGRIRIKVYSGGVLGDEDYVVKQLKFGGIDFARISISQLSSEVDELNVLLMPYLYRDDEHMWNVLDGEIGNELMGYVNKSEMEALSWYDAGARSFYTTKEPISCIEDFKGKRIRVQQSELMAEMVEALGATAVQMPYEEVYSGLQLGTIDGAENNIPSYESMGHYEIAKYYTVDEHVRIPELQLCSDVTWNKLSDEDRKIIKQCAAESAEYERLLWRQSEEEYENKMKDQGVEVIHLTADEKKRFQNAMNSVYETYCSKYIDIINRIIDTN